MIIQTHTGRIRLLLNQSITRKVIVVMKWEELPLHFCSTDINNSDGGSEGVCTKKAPEVRRVRMPPKRLYCIGAFFKPLGNKRKDH